MYTISDFLITNYIIDHCKNKTPDELTDIKFSVVNNITFASLSTRIGLHKFILARSVQLTESITHFYKRQQKINHTIGHEVRFNYILKLLLDNKTVIFLDSLSFGRK